VFCRITIAWNSGVRLVSRSGRSSSTTRSNGTSWWANASSAVPRTSPRNSRNVRDPSTVERSTRVSMKNPTRPSSSARSRPEATVPTAMSSCPDQRANSTWQAATSAMNRVPSWCCARVLSAPATSAGTVKVCTAPRLVRTAGRGRSVGSSSGGTPASRSRQYESCSSSSGPVNRSRCHTAKSAYWTGSSGSAVPPR
jgi:hypothetical protein